MPELVKDIRLYSVPEVARVCTAHSNTIRNRIEKGLIKPIVLSKNLYIEHDELVRYLKEELDLPESIIDHHLDKLKRKENRHAG